MRSRASCPRTRAGRGRKAATSSGSSFRRGLPASELLAEAEEAGVTFVKGSDFFAGGRGGERALRLAFSFVSPDEIAEGVSVLGSLVRAAAPAAL